VWMVEAERSRQGSKEDFYVEVIKCVEAST